jgi:hypothetical protein
VHYQKKKRKSLLKEKEYNSRTLKNKEDNYKR